MRLLVIHAAWQLKTTDSESIFKIGVYMYNKYAA